MFVLMPSAFSRAKLAGANAKLQGCVEHLDILTGATHRQLCGCGADIGTVEAGPDALAQVHLLRQAGIRAGGAKQGT